ncbi:MAG: hypothetical protein K0S55_2095, partial [Clostridia bacterium]|nr:hypothetical protein [Clostridia bacterium]
GDEYLRIKFKNITDFKYASEALFTGNKIFDILAKIPNDSLIKDFCNYSFNDSKNIISINLKYK